MADSLGASFLPGADQQTPNVSLPKAQNAIQFLSLQLPKTVGASAIAPASLLNPQMAGGGVGADLASAVVRSVLAAMGHTLPEASAPPSPGLNQPSPAMPVPQGPSPVPAPPTVPPPTVNSTNTGIPTAPSPPPFTPTPFQPRTPDAPLPKPPTSSAPPPTIIPGEDPGKMPAPADIPRVPDLPAPVPVPPPFGGGGGGFERPGRLSRGLD